MQLSNKIIPLLLLSFILTSSCVKLSVYKKTERQIIRLEIEKTKLENEIDRLNHDITNIKDSLSQKNKIANSIKKKSRK
ncbi:MAG: hypothetical protein ACK452_15615 [Bacteroidota bacterium]